MSGLLLDTTIDLWADGGLLGVPDPDRASMTRQGLLFRDFIVAAYPGYAFHTWAERLIGLLQRVADGEINRLIVCCPPRLGKSLLVSKLFPAYWGCWMPIGSSLVTKTFRPSGISSLPLIPATPFTPGLNG